MAAALIAAAIGHRSFGHDGSVEYTVDLANAHSQMIDMTMRIAGGRERHLDVMLPAWRPGRYVILDPAGTLQDFAAVDAETGKALSWHKLDKSTWRIDTTTAGDESKPHAVELRWRVYANSIADRTRHADATHAFISPSSVFLYEPSRRGAPAIVRIINARQGWRVATGLDPLHDDPFVLAAANYDVLVDSPLEIGLHERFVFEEGGKPHEIVLWGGGSFDEERLKRDFAAIVRAEATIFGDMPYERYVFIVHVGSDGVGGTEHLNSTVMQTSRQSFENDETYKRFLGLVAHEMFHTWNVKQLRPACIHPYDYQHENYCDLFWVVEGTTSYYDDLILLRAGLLTEREYLDMLVSQMRASLDRPGRAVQSLAEASFDAWIKHYRTTPHSSNATVNFYNQGALVSFALDMLMRERSAGRVTLDDLMRTMYEHYPLDGGGYTTDNLVRVAGELLSANVQPFFQRHVIGTEPLDFDAALTQVGLRLRFKPSKATDAPGDALTQPIDIVPLRAALGASLVDRGGRTLVRSVRSDSGAFAAGLIADDEIIALNDRRLTAAEVERRMKQFNPGDVVRVVILRRDLLQTLDIALAGEPDGRWTIDRIKAPTPAQIAAFESWSGQPWDAKRGDASSEPVAEPGSGARGAESQPASARDDSR